MTMLVLLVTASTVTAGPAVRADAVTDPASAIQRRLVPGHGVRIVSLSDPATLRAVLATTTSRRPAGMYDGVRTTVHEGVITFAQLHKVNPDMRIGARSRPTGEYASWKVSWRLWIGPDQLVRRAWSAWRDPNDSLDRSAGEPQHYSFVEDLRLSDWGMKVDIQPPPADETVSLEELDD
ncbi:hypothetical protein ACIBIZ_18050 [Nonomuraea spiralis]|uniref:hypothetical protein n=1 Tax=Nonomuraea spiralis TaxID=46182 RepID=UPI0037877E0E